MEIDSIIKKAALDVARAAVEAARDGKVVAEYLDTKEAAIYLRLSTQYLEIARHKRRGPRYIKMARAVRYKRSDLDAWMAHQGIQPIA